MESVPEGREAFGGVQPLEFCRMGVACGVAAALAEQGHLCGQNRIGGYEVGK